MIKRIKMKTMVMTVAFVLIFAVTAPVTVPFTGNVAVAKAATVKINKSKLAMEIGKKATVKISGTKSKISWTSNKKAIATVTSKGVVTAISAGTVQITATVNKKKHTCTVTVNQPANPYQTNANFEEVQIGGLSVVVPSIYDVAVEEIEEGCYYAKMKLPNSRSSIIVLANKTGEVANSYEDVAEYFGAVSEETMQADMDAAYGTNKAIVSDFSTFSYESEYGITAYAYSFITTTSVASARQISYNLSIDDYLIEVSSTDAEGYDIYIDAEYLIDSIMYIVE